eukprot:CAMPEP_0205802988 /NCGR_PEP_ID=MMETSP0205-20121125/5497_1 /ASSEMBLY_ACC=CAM_ASM_000278 /TAXON_ID=36767 /ORGANISM="Euplotes focardii, Strain TN1" /LENGTH=42 /DNA_ID= /DNA_START= /DNA_END= /DNA_ORIENTATION=
MKKKQLQNMLLNESSCDDSSSEPSQSSDQSSINAGSDSDSQE